MHLLNRSSKTFHLYGCSTTEGLSQSYLGSLRELCELYAMIAVTKPALKGQAEQPGQMGMEATSKRKVVVYWTQSESKEFGGSDQKCFDHHAFNVGYNATNAIYSTIKAAKGVWGLAPRNFFTIAFPTMPEKATLQTSFNLY